MIGTTLGRYRITAKLGEGGMGSVWRAEDPALGRIVALKLLSPALWESDTARQRFLREARAASQLDHPNIATVYDVGETDGHAWIAYQFVDGETVAASTARGPLPIAEAVALALGTAEALSHAHERGVLHRDVTAGNVMVTREGRAVLVDFGLALPERGAHLTTTGTALGTAGYMAPEVMRGETATARSDLYGLGAVFYRMLTGRLPFEGGPPEAVYYRVLNESVPPPSDTRPEVPASLERVVTKLLEREPADRHASAAELIEALREVSPEQAPTPSEQARRRAARRVRHAGAALRKFGRVRIGVAALASVALLAAGVWFAAQRGWLPGTARRPQVLAVLPFENTSADPEAVSYLGEGLGDEMVSKLGQAGGYRVLPWTTTRAFAGSKRSLTELARELHVDALLVGSFRADDERVRVTASLVDGRSGVQRWSQSFDELLSDLMTVQSNIATGVATELKGSLAPGEQQALTRASSTSAEAYSLYLQGVNYLHSPEFQLRSFATPFFERAIKLDPALAEAYVGRGAAMLDLHFRGMGGGISGLLDAERDLGRALQLDPSITRAQRARIAVATEFGHAEAALKIAAEVAQKGDSDVEGLLARGWAAMLSGLPGTAVSLFEHVLTLDPANQEASWFRVVSLQWSDQPASALEAGKAYIRRFGEDPEVYLWMGVAATALGLDHESTLYLNRSLELFGDESSNLYSVLIAAQSFARQGDGVRARSLAAHWIPILRDRLERTPDNDRILGALIGLEGVAGDSSGVEEHVQRYVQLVRSRTGVSNSGFSSAFRGVILAGTLVTLEDASSAALSEEPGNLHNMGARWYQMLTAHEPGQSTLADSRQYRFLLASIRSRCDELQRRYGPVVGLRARGS